MTKKIRWSQPESVLTREDIVFHVNELEDGQQTRLGQLQISSGGIVWYPTNAKKGRKVSWNKLIEFMSENGKLTDEKKG
ncbi:MAG TPA: hypothetical protein DEO49_01835 [Sutterella sp.]|nr:hypothetical protein [Sutterella sp.]